MSREEDSAGPGPQVVGSTTYSDSLSQSNNAVLLPSDVRAIEEVCLMFRESTLQSELRGCGAVEAETPLAWKLCVLRAPSNCGNSPESSVAANAGSPRSGTESDDPYNDALKSAVDNPYDRSEFLRGVDPKHDCVTLESCPQSTFDFSAELPAALQEKGSGHLENGVEGGTGR